MICDQDCACGKVSSADLPIGAEKSPLAAEAQGALPVPQRSDQLGRAGLSPRRETIALSLSRQPACDLREQHRMMQDAARQTSNSARFIALTVRLAENGLAIGRLDALIHGQDAETAFVIVATS